MIGVLVTDGGPHPPEKWAEVTASQIVDDIATHAPQTGVGESQEFRDKLVAILTPHHGRVQESERGALVHVPGRMQHDLDPTPHLSDPLAEIVAAAQGHTFGAYFTRPETQEYLRRVIGTHFATAMQIERSWHADRNPNTPEARAFRATHHPGGA